MRLLLARFGFFGDVILVLPVVDGIAEDSRVRSLDLLTTTQYAEIFATDPRIRRCIALDLDRPDAAVRQLAGLEYDAFVDLHSSPGDEPTNRARSAVRAAMRVGFTHSHRPELTHPIAPRGAGEHAVACYLRALRPLGVERAGPGRLALVEQDMFSAQRLLDPARPTVCLLPGSRHAWRRWPPERYAALAHELRDAGRQPVVVGHEFDRDVVLGVAADAGDAISYVTGDARALAALFRAAGVAVGNNSGLLHLAAASGARVVCLQSHLDGRMWAPWGTGHVLITGTSPAAGCDCAVNSQGDRSLPCGRTIPGAAVLEAVLAVVPDGGRPG
jgi:ADP-heptose:LPS heptosyltransferase